MFFDENEIKYKIPCVSLDIPINTVVEKRLYFLLPYMQISLFRNYVKECSNKKKTEIAENIYKYRKNIKGHLDILDKNGILSEKECSELMRCLGDVEKYLVDKDDTISQEVQAMGDNDYIPYSDRIESEAREAGKKEGKIEGKIEGKVELLYKMFNKSNEEIAKILNLDIEKVEAIIKNI